jgi:hypothetical protein
MDDETKELLAMAAKAMGIVPVNKSTFVFYIAGDKKRDFPFLEPNRIRR